MKFDKREAVKVGWEVFKKNWKFLFLVGAIVFIFSSVLNAVVQSMPDSLWPLSLLIGIFSWILGITMSIGLLKINVKAVDEEQLRFSDLYSHYRLFFKYLVAQFLSGMAALFPSMLLIGGVVLAASNSNTVFIVVGLLLSLIGVLLLIVVSTRLMFALYFVADREMGPVDALRASWSATRGEVVNLILFGLRLFAVVVIGLLALVVGVFVAIPVTTLATAYVYKKLAS